MKIITICGSKKFKNRINEIALELELKGNVVLTPVFCDTTEKLSDGEYDLLGKLHKEKIKLSDAVFIVNVDGYIGEATKSEIEFAKNLNKEIMYLQ